MDPAIKKELQVRARVESIFNKQEQDFSTKKDYDDYLEEREDIIFNLVEGIDVEDMEAKIKAYRLANADNILHNEARKAEELRRRADMEVATDRAGVSGTAAAFEGGVDPEPHQAMEYTANVPAGMVMAPVPLPVAPSEGGDAQQQASLAGEHMTHEQWQRMALCSGWSPEMAKRRAWEEAFTSVLVF